MREGYGVGIGTLREILSRLSAEGLVLAEGQRGFEVPPVTARELRELAELRLLLERTRWRSPSPPATWSGRGGWSRRTTSSSVIERRMIDGRRAEAPRLEALRRRVPSGADLRLRLAAS